MKKKLFLLVVVLLVGFVLAADDMPGAGGVSGDPGEDAEKLQENIDTFVPLDYSGKIDYGKYKPLVTKAEVRIAAINLWLDENVGWMRYIFHMKPAVSWLFIINVYVILWFFVVLFLFRPASPD